MDTSKFSKKMQKAIADAVQYLLKNPDASAYRVSKETGVTQYIARKLIAERQTPVEAYAPGPKFMALIDEALAATPAGVKLLAEASSVFAEREVAYGKAADNWRDVAAAWSLIIGAEITPSEAIRMMLTLKLLRMKKSPDHHDSIVDIAGYAAVLASVVAAEKADGN